MNESGYRSAESLIEGLLNIFNDWYYSSDSLFTHGIEGIKTHAQILSRLFGYPIGLEDILDEDDMNQFGYYFLENNKTDLAIGLFQYMVRTYPKSWNAYDSLGEAYLENGEVLLARESYKKSLKLNPSNSHAKEGLKKTGRTK